MQQLILRCSNGTYLRAFGLLGPVFGASKDRALRFDSHQEVAVMLGTHWALGDCEIETVGESRKLKRRSEPKKRKAGKRG